MKNRSNLWKQLRSLRGSPIQRANMRLVLGDLWSITRAAVWKRRSGVFVNSPSLCAARVSALSVRTWQQFLWPLEETRRFGQITVPDGDRFYYPVVNWMDRFCGLYRSHTRQRLAIDERR